PNGGKRLLAWQVPPATVHRAIHRPSGGFIPPSHVPWRINMETLRTQVARARRRLIFSSYLQAAGWCLFAALTLAAGFIVADWYWNWSLNPWLLLGAGAGAGLAAAAVWTWFARIPAI